MTISRLSVLQLVLAMLVTLPAMAQEVYPNRPITLIVNVAPGTGADIMARLIAPKLTDRLKQPVVVENRVGASFPYSAMALQEAAVRSNCGYHTDLQDRVHRARTCGQSAVYGG